MTSTSSLTSPPTFSPKKVSTASAEPDALILLPPAAQRCYRENEASRQRLQEPLEQLDYALQHLEQEVGRGHCPNCSTSDQSQSTQPYTSYQKPITSTGGLKLKVSVRKYRCPQCRERLPERSELTLFQGSYDLAVILVAVALHTCGCSYRAIRDLLHTIYRIAPAPSTILNWVQTVGIKMEQLNRDCLRSVQFDRIQLDELFGYIRSDPMSATHQPFFTTLALDDATGTILLAGVNSGRQTNLWIVKSYLHLLKIHQPQALMGDGCRSYPGAVAAILPEAEFIRDQVHAVRNLRKHPQVKQLLQDHLEDIQTYQQQSLEQQLADDRAHFRSQLLAEYRALKLTPSVRQQARNQWCTFLHWETQERQVRLEQLQQQQQLLESRLHRHLYCGRAAAREVQKRRGGRGPFSQPGTTCALEGFNRVIRHRIRQMLCFRSLDSVHAVVNLLGVRHNMTGTGRGCLYELLGVKPPTERWNPFYYFLPRKTSRSRQTQVLGTPFQQHSTKYRQQHSYQLPDPVTSLVPVMAPEAAASTCQEVLKT